MLDAREQGFDGRAVLWLALLNSPCRNLAESSNEAVRSRSPTPTIAVCACGASAAVIAGAAATFHAASNAESVNGQSLTQFARHVTRSHATKVDIRDHDVAAHGQRLGLTEIACVCHIIIGCHLTKNEGRNACR